MIKFRSAHLFSLLGIIGLLFVTNYYVWNKNFPFNFFKENDCSICINQSAQASFLMKNLKEKIHNVLAHNPFVNSYKVTAQCHKKMSMAHNEIIIKVSVKFSAVSDEVFLKVLKFLQTSYGIHIHITKAVIEKSAEITPQMLKKVAAGGKVNIFQGSFSFLLQAHPK